MVNLINWSSRILSIRLDASVGILLGLDQKLLDPQFYTDQSNRYSSLSIIFKVIIKLTQ